MTLILLNNDEMAALMRGVSGGGGFQSLLRCLQRKLNSVTGELDLSVSDKEKIKRYAFDYGDGGFEARLKEMFERHLGGNLDGN